MLLVLDISTNQEPSGLPQKAGRSQSEVNVYTSTTTLERKVSFVLSGKKTCQAINSKDVNVKGPNGK